MDNHYLDEKIIVFKNQIHQLRLQEEELEQLQDQFDFEKGWIVYQTKKMPVKKQTILNMFDMFLPKSFQVMNDTFVRIKYPALYNSDAVIFTNEDATADILFHIQGVPFIVENLPEICKIHCELLSQTHPTVKIIDVGTQTEGQTIFSYMMCVAPGTDHAIYNLVFCFCIQDCLITGACNCLAIERENWEVIFLKLLETITDLQMKGV